jgi:hypothetical protein
MLMFVREIDTSYIDNIHDMNALPPLIKMYSIFKNVPAGYSSIEKNLVDFRQYTLRTFANWRKFSGLSPVHPLVIRQIDETPVNFRQYTPWIFANWRKFSGLSPAHPLDFRQLLAKVLLAKFRNPENTIELVTNRFDCLILYRNVYFSERNKTYIDATSFASFPV